MNHSQIVSFIWSVADLIRDTLKRGKYQDVILPMTVLRRLDCVLAPTKPEVLRRYEELKGRPEAIPGQLRRASGFDFYNVSPFDFERLVADPPNLAANLRSYIARFSSNMREVLEAYRFGNTISMLAEGRLLFGVVQRFKDVDLHPDRIDNPTMGTIFEELIRKFNETLNENPGEHFTPRDVVHLMVDLMLAGDGDHIARKGAVHDIYDPCCGSGGMLMIAKEHMTVGRRENGRVVRPAINESAEIYLFGHETNPETWAISKSDLYIKDPTGSDAKNIKLGSVLSHDYHRRKFDYLITNPPYGKRWTTDKREVKAEHERGSAGRFGPGLPRISDGQLLFLLHLLSRMKEPGAGPGPGGSRVAIIMNGSPLFSGDAGSGESEIRRHVLENDLLEALIALPEQLFYNTGIATYVWLLTNRKRPERRGRVQLIDATSFWTQMKRSLGDKRREIPIGKADEVLALLAEFRDGETRTAGEDGEEEEVTVGRVFPTTRFGFRKVTVERPLRLNFLASEDRIARLDQQTAFRRLAPSRKRGKVGEEARRKGEKAQEAIRAMLADMPETLHKDRDGFLSALAAAAKDADITLRAPVRNAIVAALSERDETAEICRDRHGNPEPDPKLRDYERVPLPDGEDPADASGIPASVREFFDREVAPHRPDAWIDVSKVDKKDGKVGIVGYEINFNRHFYRFRPPRPLEEIQRDIVEIESEIVEMLRDIRRDGASMSGAPRPSDPPRVSGLGSFFRPRDAEMAGITYGELRRLEAEGVVEREARGLYRRTDAELSRFHDIAAVCARVPDAIVCLLTALVVHEIGTQLPRQVWIAIPQRNRTPVLASQGTRVMRFSGASLRYGVEDTDFEGVPARITSPARTVVDCFRFRARVGGDVGQEALDDVLRDGRVSRAEIWRAATACRARSLLGPALDARGY